MACVHAVPRMPFCDVRPFFVQIGGHSQTLTPIDPSTATRGLSFCYRLLR